MNLKVEDTTCMPSKTSYIGEDGLDDNGIYYFGDKPKKPINWKDYKKKGIRSTMKLNIRENIINESDTFDDYGMITTLDDSMSNMIGNLNDEDIDEAVRYFEKLSETLRSKNKYQDIYCYFCNADWLNPLGVDYIRRNSKPLYKSGKYNSFVVTYNGDKFVVDRFSNNFDFTVYGKDENAIRNLIYEIEQDYE